MTLYETRTYFKVTADQLTRLLCELRQLGFDLRTVQFRSADEAGSLRSCYEVTADRTASVKLE